MPVKAEVIKDKALSLTNNTSEDVRDFEIAYLHRRIENLEAIVMELLRDRVNYELVDGYMKNVQHPGFPGNSSYLKDGVRTIVYQMHRGYDPEKLGWPPLKD